MGFILNSFASLKTNPWFFLLLFFFQISLDMVLLFYIFNICNTHFNIIWAYIGVPLDRSDHKDPKNSSDKI